MHYSEAYALLVIKVTYIRDQVNIHFLGGLCSKAADESVEHVVLFDRSGPVEVVRQLDAVVDLPLVIRQPENTLRVNFNSSFTL